MCTAVVGGSIHLAATRVRAASVHAATSPTARPKRIVRRRCFRREGLAAELGLEGTLKDKGGCRRGIAELLCCSGRTNLLPVFGTTLQRAEQVLMFLRGALYHIETIYCAR